STCVAYRLVNGRQKVTHFRYDAEGRLVGLVTNDPGFPPHDAVIVRRMPAVDPDGSRRVDEFNARGVLIRVRHADGRVEQLIHDGEGRDLRTTVTDPREEPR